MDLNSIGTVEAYLNSVKSANDVQKNIAAKCTVHRAPRSVYKDTAFFSAQARASANSQVSSAESELDKSEEDAKNKSVSEMVREQTEKIDSMFSDNEYSKEKDGKLMGIKLKMRSGLELNAGEQQYLAQKDPDSYSNFQQIQSARRMFKCNLNACRTKDQVNAMRLSNALTALSEYKKAIRKGGDGAAVAGLNMAFEREIQSFVRTSGYNRLPTQAECDKFDRDLAKARKYEQEKRLAKRKKLSAKQKKKLKKTPGDGKQTVAQVLSSPNAKKVLNSRAKTTYCSCVYTNSYKNKMNSKA